MDLKEILKKHEMWLEGKEGGERADLIINQGFVGNYKSDLFVKYNQNYIYFKKIYPLLQSAEGVVVYELNDQTHTLTYIVESQKAQFNGKRYQTRERKRYKKF